MPPHHSPSTSRHSVLGGLGLVLAVSVGAFKTPSIPQGQQRHGVGHSTCASCARSSIKPSQGPYPAQSALLQRSGAGSAALSRLYSKQRSTDRGSSDVAGVGLDVNVAEGGVRPSTRSATRGGHGGGYSESEGQNAGLLEGDGDVDEDQLTTMLYSELSYTEPPETDGRERLPTTPSPQQPERQKQQQPHELERTITPASPPITTKKRKRPLIARRDALFGGVGGSLGVWAIWRSAKDMQTRDQQKPESAFVWRPVSSGEDESPSSVPSGGYPAPFTTYLARLLLNFDPQCQSWWSATVADSVPSSMPRTSPQRQQILMNRFAEFSSSVALGLNDRYVGGRGAVALFDLLTQRFSGTENQRRAKEQVALLFSLLPPPIQPVERIRGLVDSLSSSAGTSKIFTVQQLNPSSTRILLQQTMRGMQQDPLMLMPARQMLPIPVGPDGTNAPSPSEAVYFRIPGLATVMPSLAAPAPQASPPTATDDSTPTSSSSSPAASAPSPVEQQPTTARPSSAMAGFGPLSGTPVTKERPLGPETYSLFALAGAIGCSLTHMVVVPIDVVKTRAQTQKAAAAAAAVSEEAVVGSMSLATEDLDPPTPTRSDTTDDDDASRPLAAATATGAVESLSRSTPLSSSSTSASGSSGGGIVSGIKEIFATEGLKGLFCGVEPTLAGYTYYGITVYPGYEFFKRALISAVSPAAAAEFHAPLVILAGALATVIACVGVCPAEAIRIRMVTRREEFGDTVMKVVREEGISSLYDGFPPLLVRQVLFGMMKFLVFDSFAELVLSAFPGLGEQVSTRLAVSLLSGAVAGVASAIVSQPADTILSRMNTDQRPSLLDAVRSIITEHGPGGFFLGLSSRCLWSGSIISGQFLLYDVFKTLLHVTQSDLQTYMDVMASLQASL